VSDIGFENIDWNQLGNPDYLIRIGVDPTIANTLPQGGPPQPTTVGDGYITNLVTNFGSDLSRLGAVVSADLYDTGSTLGKIVDQKYPELAQRVKNGHAPGTVGEALAYRTTAAQYARAEGLPPNLLDPSKLYANDVSLPEVQSRLHNFYRAVSDSAPDVVAQLHDYYGYSAAQIGALAVDPALTEAHLVRQFEAAQIGAAGQRTGYGGVDTATAEQLAAQGVTADQAQTGFGNLAQQRPLFAALPGSGEDTIGTGEQVAATFSNSQAAQERIRRRREQRQAQFAGGGQFGGGQRGVGGLGSAVTP
jgi:hypothetical protein